VSERIPAFICNRDRLTWPRKLADDLSRDGRCQVIIADNASTYPPLLDWYTSCPYEVIRFEENVGPHGDWRGEIHRRVASGFFLMTDPDLDISLVPSDWLSVLLEGFRYPDIDKVGFSLRTDDLPEGPGIQEIVEWESGFQKWPINERYYWARIDTTLALYDLRRFDPGRRRHRDRALRTAAPYAARHLPWYPLEGELLAEEEYYLLHCDGGMTHWSRARIDETVERQRSRNR
jgi:hypothetical protein